LMLLGEGLFDYQDACGDPTAFSQDLQRESLSLASAWKWNEVRVTGVADASPFGGYWNRWAGGQDFASAPRRPAQAPPLPRQHPRYARRWRQAEALGIRLQEEASPSNRRAVLGWLLEHKAERFGVNNVLQPLACLWLEMMVENEPELTELWSLRQGDAILSALLCWRGLAVRSAYTISYDLRAAELSPGVLLLYAVVCRSAKEQMDFDFLTGEQNFKRQFATETTRLLRFHCARTQLHECRPS
ncbi:MAG: GNAT family N-acetyltransferase, partial [Terriglobales bacterium]